MNPWLPLIGVLLGGLLTGGFAWLNSWSQRRHQQEQDRKKLYREKLQELYEVVSDFKNRLPDVRNDRLQAEIIKISKRNQIW